MKIAQRKLEPYWEVHLRLEDGNYWMALDVEEGRGPTINDEAVAKRLAMAAEKTYGSKHLLRLVKYTPEIVDPTS